MTRRQTLVAAAILAGLAAVVFVLVAANRRARLEQAMPAWLNPEQPPDQVGPACPSPAESWAAARPSNLTACCYGHGAGRRVMRDYPATLAESRSSFIRTGLELEGRIN